MSLSHHWLRATELPADTFARAVRDVVKVLPKLDVPLAGVDGTGSPILRDDVICFNGQNPRSVEPFEIHQVEFDRRSRKVHWSHTKTEGAPYDLAVRAALVVLKHHLGQRLVVTSDDRGGSQWDNVRQVVQDTLGFGGDFAVDADDAQPVT